MKTRHALLTAFLLCVAPTVAASPVVDGLPPNVESLLRNPTFSVLVVSITEATVESGTNGSPPHGTLDVEVVLRGRYFSAEEYRYRMMPSRGGSGYDDLRPEWSTKPLDGPASGDRLIVFSYTSKAVAPGSVFTLQGPLIRDTPEVRRQLEARLVHESWLRVPLFFIVLFLPLMALGALLVSRNSPPASGSARMLSRLSMILPPLAFLFYFLYEWLLSSAYDIRVDLLLLWPVLALGAIVWVIAGQSAGRRWG